MITVVGETQDHAAIETTMSTALLPATQAATIEIADVTRMVTITIAMVSKI